MISEKQATTFNGYISIVVLLLLQAGSLLAVAALPPLLKIIFGLLAVIVFVCWFGFFMVNPNQSRVLQLFGNYVGTETANGLGQSTLFQGASLGTGT